ncbi:MAG: aminotransferase class V-fold PLP-dependent enzyme, partial [Desulfurococcaceae archaeon]|nr:aminotransferase class V-fold PLP-dependent enzyme [Sulfolobales archaeon]MDW8170842.1 aminotransferase class V-fold PLP-dependent enzyme [Desulfurococcaceae archaeon]
MSDIKHGVSELLKVHGKPFREVYLDSENSGVIFTEALNEMIKCYTEFGYGHPSITNKVGWEAYEIISKSSEVICRTLGCSLDEIVYTHSGTEANNLAILGLAKANNNFRRKIVVSSIEHLSIIHTAESLVKYGFEIVKIPCDNEGFIHPDILSSIIDSNTLMVSIGFVNHEIGTIQNLKSLIEIVKDKDENIFFHTDAVEALGKLKFNLKDLNVDLASFSSHKVFGPKGAGCLYVREGLNLEPILFGQLSTQRLWPGL